MTQCMIFIAVDARRPILVKQVDALKTQSRIFGHYLVLRVQTCS